jgi:hypothetical protein
MSPAQDSGQLKRAIAEESAEMSSLLFLWLTSEPSVASDYLDIATVLAETGKGELARLVAHRGLALFPDSDQLALFALRLELSGLPRAA